MIDVLGITVHEPDVVITDIILFAESIAFAYLLWNRATKKILFRQLFVVLFLSLAASSILGAIFHAFFPLKVASQGGSVMWLLVTVAIGLTASSIWCINALIFKGVRLFKIMFYLTILYLAALVYSVAFISADFIVIVMFYIPPLAVFALISFYRLLKDRTKSWAYLFIGLVLSFIAAAVQHFGVELHSLYFDHNALYHVIQAIALALIFFGAQLFLEDRHNGDRLII